MNDSLLKMLSSVYVSLKIFVSCLSQFVQMLKISRRTSEWPAFKDIRHGIVRAWLALQGQAENDQTQLNCVLDLDIGKVNVTCRARVSIPAKTCIGCIKDAMSSCN